MHLNPWKKCLFKLMLENEKLNECIQLFRFHWKSSVSEQQITRSLAYSNNIEPEHQLLQARIRAEVYSGIKALFENFVRNWYTFLMLYLKENPICKKVEAYDKYRVWNFKKDQGKCYLQKMFFFKHLPSIALCELNRRKSFRRNDSFS